MTKATKKAALTMIACFHTRTVLISSGFVASAAGHPLQLEHTSEKELPGWWVFKPQALTVVQKLGCDHKSSFPQCAHAVHAAGLVCHYLNFYVRTTRVMHFGAFGISRLYIAGHK